MFIGDQSDIPLRLIRGLQPAMISGHLEQAEEEHPQIGVREGGDESLAIESFEGGAHDAVESRTSGR